MTASTPPIPGSPRLLRSPSRTGAVLLAALVGVALVSTACSGGASEDPPTKPTITVYNGQHEQTTNALVAAFEKKTGDQREGAQR